MFTRFALRLFVLFAVVFVPLTFEGGASAGNRFPEVTFETSMGTFTLELYPAKAPGTVANFLAYVEEGFYDNTLIHRTVPDFVIQGGGFEQGMKARETRDSIRNESDNRLKNLRGSVAMARRFHPDTATSQFYINLVDNAGMDYKSKVMPGYAVFGSVVEGMDVVDKISKVPTHSVDKYNDVPEQDVIVLSARRTDGVSAGAEAGEQGAAARELFEAGDDYVVLERPVPTRDRNRIEVVEMFSYGCPHCYEFEPMVREWSDRQAEDVDFWFFHAVWSEAMKLYARAFYTAKQLGVGDRIHAPLFTALVQEHRSIRNEADLADFFAARGVDKAAFTEAFNSDEVDQGVQYAEQRVRLYHPSGVPEIVVNGKYRVDRMHAGGLAEMLTITEFLVDRERKALQLPQTAHGDGPAGDPAL
jgi:cyclophilin family peptidyl-prolyl cis-trans isomerase/protein-disulfide isomerase